MSTLYRWWYLIYPIATCAGKNVRHVHFFHAVLPALQLVAAGMKQGGQVEVRVGKV